MQLEQLGGVEEELGLHEVEQLAQLPLKSGVKNGQSEHQFQLKQLQFLQRHLQLHEPGLVWHDDAGEMVQVDDDVALEDGEEGHCVDHLSGHFQQKLLRSRGYGRHGWSQEEGKAGVQKTTFLRTPAWHFQPLVWQEVIEGGGGQGEPW